MGGNPEDNREPMLVVTLAVLPQIKFLCLTTTLPWKNKDRWLQM